MSAFRVRCPAKINLALRVGPPEPDGYHPLSTIFQAVGLCDDLLVEESAEDSLHVEGVDLPRDNTLTLALEAARKKACIPALSMSLTKRIPAESGLGGGSSDAAGLLRCLAAHYELSAEDAHACARQVGADVPFFLVGGRAKGEGRGDILTPMPDASTQWCLIARPEVGVSTPAAYRALDAANRSASLEPLEGNDFELVCPPECTALIEQMQSLGVRQANLSGSGSAVFGLFESKRQARASAEHFGVPTWIAPTLTREESLWMQ